MFVSQEPVPTIHHYSNREYHKIRAHLIASLSSIFLSLIHQNKIYPTLLFMSWCQELTVCWVRSTSHQIPGLPQWLMAE